MFFRLLLSFATFGLICSVKSESFPLSKLADLDENNWRAMLEGEWMVEFYAPWCPACKTLAPTWEKFAISAGNHGVHVGRIDVTKSPSLSGRFFVVALPTIYHVVNGEFRQYRGARDGDAFILHIKEKQWKQTEPLSAWKQPNSIHMSLLSYFFKLSHYLKDLNARLQDEYGVPTWGSYALFAIATIFIGAFLGLILVCIVDFLYPPKKAHRQSFSESKERDKDEKGIEEVPADELEDDEPEDEENEQDRSTSEGERNSNSDSETQEIAKSEEEELEKRETKEQTENSDLQKEKNKEIPETVEKKDDEDDTEKINPEVRKRKPRKAD